MRGRKIDSYWAPSTQNFTFLRLTNDNNGKSVRNGVLLWLFFRGPSEYNKRNNSNHREKKHSGRVFGARVVRGRTLTAWS